MAKMTAIMRVQYEGLELLSQGLNRTSYNTAVANECRTPTTGVVSTVVTDNQYEHKEV